MSCRCVLGRAEYIDRFRELYCESMQDTQATDHLDSQFRAEFRQVVWPH
jgi:hypothetical protein